jgi:hypothetical protein
MPLETPKWAPPALYKSSWRTRSEHLWVHAMWPTFIVRKRFTKRLQTLPWLHLGRGVFPNNGGGYGRILSRNWVSYLTWQMIFTFAFPIWRIDEFIFNRVCMSQCKQHPWQYFPRPRVTSFRKCFVMEQLYEGNKLVFMFYNLSNSYNRENWSMDVLTASPPLQPPTNVSRIQKWGANVLIHNAPQDSQIYLMLERVWTQFTILTPVQSRIRRDWVCRSCCPKRTGTIFQFRLDVSGTER